MQVELIGILEHMMFQQSESPEIITTLNYVTPFLAYRQAIAAAEANSPSDRKSNAETVTTNSYHNVSALPR
jgi:hypothetical protein